MQISHASQQVFCHSRVRHTDCSANFHTFYNHAFSIGRVYTCCTFHKPGSWAVPPGKPLGIKPFCLLSSFGKVMNTMSMLLYPSCNFCSVYVQHWTNDTPLPRPITQSEVPSPQQPPRGTTEPDRVRDPHKDRSAVALKLQEGDPELKDNIACGNPALFMHTQLFKLTAYRCTSLKNGPRLKLILLWQWQPAKQQNMSIWYFTQLSCFDCICYTLVDL